MLRPGQCIALCVLALLTLGVVMVNSADMAVRLVGADTPQDPGVTARSIILSRSTVYMGLALAALAVGAMVPIRRLAAVAATVGSNPNRPADAVRPLVLACLALIGLCALAYAPGIGREINGAHRWIGLGGAPTGKADGGLTMQPSEIAKWAFIAVMAWYCTVRASALPRFFTGLVPALVALAAVAGFIVLEDLGTGALIAVTACVILLASGARLWQFLMFVPVAGAAFVAAILTNPYRIKRVTAFIDPYADPEKTGFHMIQSLVAVANGKGAGRGLGWSIQKMGYLPEDRTDFIFAIICEELGIAGAGLVISLFMALLWSCAAVVSRERDPLLRLFVLGVMTTVGIQALINLAVVTGLAPTKGIALPLLSSGGTGWILTAFSLGLIIAVDRTRSGANLAGASTDAAP